MAALPYKPTTRRGYSERAGIRLLVALEGEGADPFTAAQAIDAGAALGLSSRHTVKLLHQLAAGGWLTRVKKRLYAINDPVTRRPMGAAPVGGSGPAQPLERG